MSLNEKLTIEIEPLQLSEVVEARAPTGNKFTINGVNFWRIVNGKVVERKSVRDWLDFFRQIGLIEPTEKAKQLFP